ncbi:MAG: hypothetical protein AAFZ18_18285 [Myxococcota bacterium]
MRLDHLLGPLLAGSLLAGCNDDTPAIVVVPPAPDAGCFMDETARTFEVYFVIDVSGSMQAFLQDLSEELASFALTFPERNLNGDRILVSYFVVAFVNDVRLFPTGAERMTSHIAVSNAIRDAIAVAEGNRNLSSNTPNSDMDENLLDALGTVIDRAPSPDDLLVLVATDQSFREAPETLSGGITVTRTYEEVLTGLRDLDAQVTALVNGPQDGLTRPYLGQDPLTTLGNGQVYDLGDLTGAQEDIRDTLEGIARDATCDAPPAGS